MLTTHIHKKFKTGLIYWFIICLAFIGNPLSKLYSNTTYIGAGSSYVIKKNNQSIQYSDTGLINSTISSNTSYENQIFTNKYNNSLSSETSLYAFAGLSLAKLVNLGVEGGIRNQNLIAYLDKNKELQDNKIGTALNQKIKFALFNISIYFNQLLDMKIAPYIGSGLGFAILSKGVDYSLDTIFNKSNIDIDLSTDGNYSNSTKIPIYELKAGASIKLSNVISVNIGYKYMLLNTKNYIRNHHIKSETSEIGSQTKDALTINHVKFKKNSLMIDTDNYSNHSIDCSVIFNLY